MHMTARIRHVENDAVTGGTVGGIIRPSGKGDSQ